MPSPPAAPPPPLRFEGDPAEAAAQLVRGLVAVRSVWFPTPKELRAWEGSGVPLYARRIGRTTVEVGPRLGSMWASCFSPVDELGFGADGVVTQRRRFPRFTTGLLVVWWVAIAGWGASELPLVVSGDMHPAWLVFFGLLAGSAGLGPVVGWRMGGAWLDAHREWVVDGIEGRDEGENW
jgi:hypothetical protein